MTNLSVYLVNQPLERLEEIAQRYNGMDLELAVAYISAGGVLDLSQLIKAARRTRITVGVSPINRVAAFRRLQELGAEVFIYLAEPGSVFHPKVYYGVNERLAWAMIGSSNLTSNGLGLNIELNLLVEGRRFTEPFTRLEAILEGYRRQARPLTEDLLKELESAEQRLGSYIHERAYTNYLRTKGMKSAPRPTLIIPEQLQNQALEELERYLQETRMVYAYQMLLCLVMLVYADEHGFFSQQQAAACFRRFYQLRDREELPRERQRGGRRAAIDDPELEDSAFIEIIRIDPFPRLERRGLLEASPEGDYYIVNPALMRALTPDVRARLRELAIQRLVQHFGEDRVTIERLVAEAIG
ncbi:phospholipase D-like domain-containing protein [Thermogemmatispora carboxidivorans]|uniref:phospholipase D-like domain-containing protein n=1 Tax=Thermogemmatispora carboxidivorans TaxID=1382306 RepID=UPI00069B25BA|nr:phospholipase D-like domain-containing protein [Thermogemmatispora carboxidivorans]